MKAVSPKTTYEYVPKCDRELPPDEQTVAVFSHLTIEQEAYLDDRTGSLDADGGYQITMGSQNLLALHMGLKELRNFHDPDGNLVELQRDQNKKANLPEVGRPWKTSQLSFIEKSVRQEFAEVIRKGGEIEEEDRKN